jgi:hypothetical protein
MVKPMNPPEVASAMEIQLSDVASDDEALT